MKTNSTCCGSTTTTCESTIAELPRYYPRQLITPEDLTLEQDYFRDRLRRHNRLLHGWGVVCGALVCPVTTKDAQGVVSVNTWQVHIQPGYILGPYGDEIILDCTRTVDLRTNGVSGVTGDPCIDVPDPWCSQVTVPRNTGPLYIAVKYKQSMMRPVRVQPIGCGCDDNTCECSRWHDGYEIGILPCCPDAGLKPPDPKTLIGGDIPVCPDCPPQPWVVLAAMQVESDGTITSIDNCACRRLVVSLAGFWWQCSEGKTKTQINSVTVAGSTTSPGQITARGPDVTATVKGVNLGSEDTYTFGNGIMVKNQIPTPGTSDSSIDLTLSAGSTADQGLRTLVVVKKDCSTATLADSINVVPPAKSAALKAAPMAKPSSAKAGPAKGGKKADTTPGEP